METRYYIFVVIISLFIIGGVLIPSKNITTYENISYDVEEEYQVTETIMVNETYEALVEDFVEECGPLSLDGSILYGLGERNSYDGNEVPVYCDIRSKEDHPVDITYQMTLVKKVNGKCDYDDVLDQIGPRNITLNAYGFTSKQTTLRFEKDNKIYKDYCYDCSAWNQEEGCWNESVLVMGNQTKQVPKEISVTKTRNVTKHKTNTIITQVNWLTGKRLPWMSQTKIEG